MSYDACPYCHEELRREIYACWSGGDASGEDFEMECPKCRETFVVSVEPVPDFRCEKKRKEARSEPSPVAAQDGGSPRKDAAPGGPSG